MRINPIPSGDWITSRQARQLMMAAAIATAVSGAALLGIHLSSSFASWFTNEHRWIANVVGAVGAAGSLSLFFGMWRYWYQEKEPSWIHLAWAVAFVCAVWYASLLYWAVRYSRFSTSGN